MPAAAHTPAEHQPKPSIARIWRGRVKRERADEYEEYNFETGVRPLIQNALGVQCFREDREAETEFVTISYWRTSKPCRVSLGVTLPRSITCRATLSSSSKSQKCSDSTDLRKPWADWLASAFPKQM